MSRLSLWSIILLEGFVTVSLQILTIRQLMPMVGNSVIVTSLIIGVFLLFLALGYRRGGRIQHTFRECLERNFSWAALILAIGLSFLGVSTWFHLMQQWAGVNLFFALILYLLCITAPLVYLLGQTVPITMNLFKEVNAQGHVGYIGGTALYLSTLGSFLGAVLTSVILMNFLGVAWCVFVNVAILALLIIILRQFKSVYPAILVFAIAIGFAFNVGLESYYFIKTNAYTNYRVESRVKLRDSQRVGKVLYMNNSPSSFVNDEKKGFDYAEVLKKMLFRQLKLAGKDILVLGAGGFSLSAESDFGNRFTYVDIDSDLYEVAKKHFLQPINGEFIAKDARIYLNQTEKKYDVIISDVYSNKRMLPMHLGTLEYFQEIRARLSRKGIFVGNIIANPFLNNAYSKRLDNTIRQVFGSCMVVPTRLSQKPSNILYICYNDENTDAGIYRDDKNTISMDNFFQSSGE